MRALLVREVRNASLMLFRRLDEQPRHLKPDVAAVQCQIRTASGVDLSAVLAGPESGKLDFSLI